MRFGPVPLSEAEGGILAHSITVDGARLKKGRVLRSTDVAALAAAGIAEVTTARMEPGDMGEDAAAATIAAALVPDPAACGLTVSAPFTGRVNFFAGAAGVLRIAAGAVDALNRINPAITLASLSDHARVQPRQMVATVKIIPYGVPGAAVLRACGAVVSAALRLHPFRDRPVSLILTRTPGMKPTLIDKGRAAVEARLAALGLTLAQVETVPHESAAVAAALVRATGELVLILSGSATSDAYDTCPAGLKAAGGTLARFGMPVDPGNLLFIGEHAGRPVLGLPGCARSPALNGADWVLERLAADLPVTDEDIAAMGVGGLLKEIPSRPQPRAGHAAPPGRPRIEAILLAAGAARRMGGRDKLLEPVGDEPILRAVAAAARASQVDRVIAVLPPWAAARRAALDGLALDLVEAPDWAEGMAASLRAGLAAVSPEAEAVVILLADMPEVTAGHIDRLLAAFDPEEGREICRAVSETGVPGHPVLFGRRFFESLLQLTGDRGARELLRDAPEFVTDVPTPGEGAAIDLDTPEAWEAWRAGRPG
jgi:molybdenum cofactor cytidylyltransferase